MEELVSIKNNKVVCTSLDVAESFGKAHNHVLRDIRQLECSEKFKQSNFGQGFITTTVNTIQPMYYMTKDGFTILVMGYTGKKAMEFKEKYIAAFNKMEKIITERKTADWQQARKNGKDIRLQETDTIKKLVEYAESQGSKHADKLYLVYTKLAKKIVEGCRDEIECMELIHLTTIERLILETIQQGMMQYMDYKLIYQICKERLIEYERVSTNKYFISNN